MGQDQSAFFDAMQHEGVTPLKPKIRHQLARAKTDADLFDLRRKSATEGEDQGLTTAPIDWVHPLDPIEWCRDGVQHGVYRNLRLGKYQADSRLDIINKTPEQAKDELLPFLQESMRLGIRTVIINHGKGKLTSSPGNKLKSYLNCWLPQLAQVMCFHSAMPQHGGSGAVYVLLKKSDSSRRENLEKHAKRR